VKTVKNFMKQKVEGLEKEVARLQLFADKMGPRLEQKNEQISELMRVKKLYETERAEEARYEQKMKDTQRLHSVISRYERLVKKVMVRSVAFPRKQYIPSGSLKGSVASSVSSSHGNSLSDSGESGEEL